MKVEEYEALKNIIIPQPISMNTGELAIYTWRWQMLKAIWELTRAVKGGLDE